MAAFSYRPDPQWPNDTFDSAGNVRPHWRYLLESLEQLGPEALTERQHKAERLLRDEGATYNIYHDTQTQPSGFQSPRDNTWKLDLIPSVLPSEDWVKIEMGLLERAELFNLLFKDLYGPRDLIRTGVLPPEAVFLHPGFLRPCHGVRLPGDHQLILHSADMMRDTQGDLCVITDRTQSPSGAGYALENRTIMSRVMPSLYRDSHVHRLALFFQKLRSKLSSLSQEDQPRVVLLTPGPHNEAYFEHAYLANYLGFHLVQSGDLIVRNGYVWMKSLDGLSRVDVIWRRVDDSFCDPVELRGDSFLGLPSLLEVARAGRVAIANPLGSGLLENPIFLKYLPQIAEALLGRQLRLATVATLWLGDDLDWSQLQHSQEDWVLKPIFRGHQHESIRLSPEKTPARQAQLQNLATNRARWVAQPLLAAQHLPCFKEGELVSRPATLRTFSLASDQSYITLPGGLTRIGPKPGAFFISNQAGAESKDTWVIASEPERIVTNLPKGEPGSAQREADLIGLPSRVVENLFWFGRYAERAEALLRLLRTLFVMLNGEEALTEACRRQLLCAVGEVSGSLPHSPSQDSHTLAHPEAELIALIADGQRQGSVRSNLNALLYCANESKELLSSDILRVINDISDALVQLDASLQTPAHQAAAIAAPDEALGPLITALMALAGLAQESMLRGPGWRFMQIGKRLERSVQTAAIIEHLIVPELSEQEQSTLIQALLLTLENLISYRRRYRARMGVQSCLDLVLLDAQNPRALLFQLQSVSEHLKSLPRANEGRHELPREERAAFEAEAQTRLVQLTELAARAQGERPALKALCQQISALMAQVSNAMTDKYFDHKTSSQQLVRPRQGA